MLKTLTIVLLLALLAGCTSTSQEDPIAWARGVKPIVEDRAIIQQQRRDLEQRNWQTMRQLSAADAALIPYEPLLTYAPDWPRISENRNRAEQPTSR